MEDNIFCFHEMNLRNSRPLRWRFEKQDSVCSVRSRLSLWEVFHRFFIFLTSLNANDRNLIVLLF
jgi:hypothetical protein